MVQLYVCFAVIKVIQIPLSLFFWNYPNTMNVTDLPSNSASPTPTMIIDKGRLEACKIDKGRLEACKIDKGRLEACKIDKGRLEACRKDFQITNSGNRQG